MPFKVPGSLAMNANVIMLDGMIKLINVNAEELQIQEQ